MPVRVALHDGCDPTHSRFEFYWNDDWHNFAALPLSPSGMRVRSWLQVGHTAARVYSTSDMTRGGFSWDTCASPTFLISETTAPATDEGGCCLEN